MKAKIEVLSKTVDGVEKDLFPLTVTEGVVDPETKKNAKELFEEKADHGYEENPKTLKEVDNEKANHGYSEEEEPKTLKQVETEKSAELDQLADDVNLFKEKSNLKDAIQDSKIKDIESVISTMNPNQSAQLSVSGRKTISLPKNASNGGMGVKLEGLTAENLVVNGDFRNGTTGWIVNSGASLTVVDGVATFLPSQDGLQYVLKTMAIKKGSIYYLSAFIDADAQIGFIFGDGASYASQSTIIQTSYNTPGVVSRTSRIISLGDKTNATTILSRETTAFSFKNVMCVNLTDTFGAGNEPDLATCDEIFSDYFEGLKSFEPTGRVRSVGKNLFDASKYPFTEGVWISLLYGFVNVNPDYSGTEKPIPILPNTTYSLSPNVGGSQSGFALYDSGLKYITGGKNGTFTTPSNARYIRFTVNAGDEAIAQLELGTIKTSYEPYKETNLYLTAPELRSNGTVKDEIRKGANGYELVKRISDVDGSVLTTPEIIPISYGGVLNSAENGTVYHEPIIADAGVYGANLPILMQDYPIATIEEIIKHENGVDTYLNVASAVVASDGLSFTHPDLADGDLVLFTYAFDKESTNGNITATFYDSNVVKIDTVTGKAYKIEDVVTNGVLTRTLTEV